MTFLKPAEKLGRKFLNPVPTEVGGLSLALKILPQYLFHNEERVPRTPLGPFRTDASVYAIPPGSGLRVTWMGHSTMLVEIDGVRILIDPVWDERASPVQWFGPKRFFAPPLALEELPPLDAILISHDHFDHLGAGTVRALATLHAAANARWVTSLGVGNILSGFGVRSARITELDWTQPVVVTASSGARCNITSIPARHFSGRSAFNRFETLWASFALRGASHSIYFGADSGWWEGFGEIGSAHGPFDLVMLEIGAFNELWQQIHLGPERAAQAFRALNPAGEGLLMPIHWGLFNLALHAWRQPIQRLSALADEQKIKLWSPQPGLPTEFVSSAELRAGWWR